MAIYQKFLIGLALICAFQLQICIADSFTCRDEFSGAPVDWWIIYKFPEEAKTAPSGTSYAYMDANTYTSGQWKISTKSLDDSSSSLSSTLDPIYSNPSGYIMWNDESPSGHKTSTKAHAKGLMTLDLAGGLFIRHSIPRFPEDPSQGSYSFPDNERVYGQTLLCITMRIDQLNELAGQYIINNPYVYASSIPNGVNSAYPYFQQLVKLTKKQERDVSAQSVPTNITNVYSAGGTLFTDFAKDKAWDNDLYDNLVAPYYSTNLIVESWGRPLMPSSCSNYKTMNVKEVTFDSAISFSETKDHAKWAASPNSAHRSLLSNAYVTCIGDINRMTSQRKRGGGATCIINASINAAFNDLATKIESC
jgi:deoxyribonuclease-2